MIWQVLLKESILEINMNSIYYFIKSSPKGIRVKKIAYLDDKIDKKLIGLGNAFKTREEAEEMVDKIKILLKGGE